MQWKYLSLSNLPIRWKFASYVVLPTVLVFTVFIWFTVLDIRKSNLSSHSALLLESITITSARLDRELSGLERIVETQRAQLEAGFIKGEEEFYRALEITLANHPLVYGAAIAFEPYAWEPERRLFSPYVYRSANGSARLDIGAIETGSGYDYTSGAWEWWSTPRTRGQAHWSSPYFDAGAGNVLMTTYSSPFYRNGQFAGVVTADLALGELFSLFFPEVTTREIIIASDAAYIQHPDPAQILEGSLLSSHPDYAPEALQQLWEDLQSHGAGIHAIDRSQPEAAAPGLVFYAHIPVSDWYYLHFATEDEVLALGPSRWLAYLGVLGFVGFLLTLLLIVLSGKFTAPIRELQFAAERVAKGDYDISFSYHSDDELGRLGAAFAHMTTALGSRREDLERKVNERTATLQAQEAVLSKQKGQLEERVKELNEARLASLNMMQDVELARADLANQLALQQALIDTVPYPLFFKGPDTRFMGFNKAYEETFAINRKDLIGLRVLDLHYLPEADRVAYQAEDEDCIANQKLVHHEMRIPFADGKLHDTLYWVSGFRKSDGSPGGLVGTFVDISEQKEISQQLEIARNKAEAATEAKANFLASMSHEIRTPMNGIIGMVQLLQQSNLGSEHNTMLQTIADSGHSLLTIINDILDFSKIEAGMMQFEAIGVSLQDLMESCAETLAPAAQGKKLGLITVVDPAIPREVIGDPVRIRQILINLGGNAIKFSQQGQVIMRADLLPGTSESALCVRFSVLDQGIGISHEAQTRLFQAFTQAESSTTREFGGTGLGLSICQRLTHMMQGEIGVHSEPGKGSEFFVELPFQRSPSDPGAREQSTLLGLKVAVMSGLAAELEACTRYLQFWGVEVTALAVAPDTDLLHLLGAMELTPDVCVLGSGFTFAAQQHAMTCLAQESRYAALHAVALTAGRQRNQPRLLNEHLVAIDINPLKRRAFLSAVAIAAGRESPELEYPGDVEDLRAASVPGIDEARARNCLILVAEDNPTNQVVIRRQLHLLGYACVMVSNGQLALNAWRGGGFALLLTDCHMPEMDGYELSRSIRHEETSAARLTIIAITANALQGEREKCLAAGMNDCLTKPIDIRELRKRLQHWMPGAITSGPSSLAGNTIVSPDNAALCPIDASVLLNLFGDAQTAQEVLIQFIDSAEALVEEILAACKQGSAKGVKEAAHKLKAAALSVGAQQLGELAGELEQAGKSGTIGSKDAQVQQLALVMAEIRHFASQQTR